MHILLDGDHLHCIYVNFENKYIKIHVRACMNNLIILILLLSGNPNTGQVLTTAQVLTESEGKIWVTFYFFHFFEWEKNKKKLSPGGTSFPRQKKLF